jgi:hypothetical protein
MERDTTLLQVRVKETITMRFARLPRHVRFLLIFSTFMLAMAIALVSTMLHARALAVRPVLWITNGSPAHCEHIAGAVQEQTPFTQPAQACTDVTNESTAVCTAGGNGYELGAGAPCR